VRALCAVITADRPDLTDEEVHLLEATEPAHVSVRVLPLTASPHRASVSGRSPSWSSRRTEERGEPPTVYGESLTGVLYRERPKELAIYEEVWSAPCSVRAFAPANGDCVEVADNLDGVKSGEFNL
jgi:hypothetical protein